MSLAVQRKHEERRSLFSCFYWAIFSWNSQEMEAAGAPPPRSLWGNVLVSRCPAPFIIKCIAFAHSLTMALNHGCMPLCAPRPTCPLWHAFRGVGLTSVRQRHRALQSSKAEHCSRVGTGWASAERLSGGGTAGGAAGAADHPQQAGLRPRRYTGKPGHAASANDAGAHVLPDISSGT